MVYQLTEEEKMIVNLVKKLAAEKVAPRAAEIDEKEEFPWDIYKLFSEHGLMALPVPEEYGGTGARVLLQCLLVEEISKYCSTCATLLTGPSLGTYPIIFAGTAEQKEKYTLRLASGEIQSAFGLTEPDAGSDVASMKSTARREGEEYVLNGTKRFITRGNISDLVIIFAKTDPGKKGRGITAFIVEKGTPGFKCTKLEKKMGLRGSPTAELVLEDVRIPKENRLGEEGEGLKLALYTLDHTRCLIGASAVGRAQGAFDYACEYAKQRVQFGQPIGKFQAIQFMLADMAIEIEAARQLTYLAADEVDKRGPKMVLYGSMAKTKASDIALKVCEDAVQILGGYGFISEYPLERMFRDCKIAQIAEGTNQIHRTVIAREILGRF
jgi:alkylation response protein AidB-like acyl-CoA dehydrogenase